MWLFPHTPWPCSCKPLWAALGYDILHGPLITESSDMSRLGSPIECVKATTDTITLFPSAGLRCLSGKRDNTMRHGDRSGHPGEVIHWEAGAAPAGACHRCGGSREPGAVTIHLGFTMLSGPCHGVSVQIPRCWRHVGLGRRAGRAESLREAHTPVHGTQNLTPERKSGAARPGACSTRLCRYGTAWRDTLWGLPSSQRGHAPWPRNPGGQAI